MFSLKVSNSVTRNFVITVKGFKRATSCVKDASWFLKHLESASVSVYVNDNITSNRRKNLCS